MYYVFKTHDTIIKKCIILINLTVFFCIDINFYIYIDKEMLYIVYSFQI